MKRTVLMLLLATLPSLGTVALGASENLAELKAALRSRQYSQAVALVDSSVAANGAQADEALYLKATALLLSKKFPEAEAASQQLVSKWPKSDWRFKAIFLRAQAFVEQKKFAEAAKIYEAEAGRILSTERKEELVGEILRFAEKLQAKPDPNVPDAPKPDFNKAYSLYTKALEMELPREFRDDILFRKARASQQGRSSAQAIRDYQTYLAEYDPSWSGPAGAGSDRRQNPLPAGKHVDEARYDLAESRVENGAPEAARLEIEDLEKRNPDPVLLEKARWLRIQTYIQPTNRREDGAGGRGEASEGLVNNIMAPIGNTGGVPTIDSRLYRPVQGDLDMALKACRDYLAAYPSGSRAIRAKWMIAEVLEAAGRSDEAIAAYRAFLNEEGGALPKGEAANAIEEEIGTSPATFLVNLKMRAVFRIGSIFASQKKQEQAIAAWQEYAKEYPNGPQWSECQNGIINAEFQMGLDALGAKQESLAMDRFNAFLRAHPLDSRAPKILYIFGAVQEAKALELEADQKDQKDQKAGATKEQIAASYREAIEEWAKLVSKYPESPEARSAMLKSGNLLEDKLGEYEKALKLYQKLANERGDSAASAAMGRLTGKSLQLSAERTFRTTEKPVVQLKLRNIEKCEVRVYKIDLQSYFRKRHAIIGVEGLDVSLIQPDKTWSFKPEGYRKYQPMEQSVEIPFKDNEPGAYVVSIGDDDWESTVLVLRSDLEVVVKSSRREALAFVQDMVTGKPAANAEVLLSDGSAVLATGSTGEDGVFKTSLDQLKSQDELRVFALRAGHAAAFNLPLSGLQLSAGLTAKGYLYTDRPAYMPGETVAVRGVLRDVKNGSYAVPEEADFQVRFTDPQGRVVSEQSVRLSKFGTFGASLDLPGKAPVGQYTMTAQQERKGRETFSFQGSFEVREFKLEKIKLALDFPRRVWFRGEKVEASLKASYYWGEPVAGRVLRCSLPDGSTHLVTTDASGNAKLDFDTSGMLPGRPLRFEASLEGENVAVSESVALARLGFSIEAKPSQPVVIAGEPFDIELATTDADGKSIGQSLSLAVSRKAKPKTSRVLSLLPWSQTQADASAEVTETEITGKTDPQNGKARVSLKLEKGGIYQIRVSGTDRFGQPVAAQTTVEVSDGEDATKLRIFADQSTLKVGEPAKVRIHSRLDRGLALLTYEGETILRHQIVVLHKDYNPVEFNVGHDLFPNFRLASAVIDGRNLRAASKEFSVERELKVAVNPRKKTYLPGEEGEVELAVTDQAGHPVEAEMSLALVNESLFAVCPDRTTPILEFFQKEARRNAGFKTEASCGFSYQGVTRAVPKVLSEERDRLAREREETESRSSTLANLPLAGTASPTPVTSPLAYDKLKLFGAITAIQSGGLASGGRVANEFADRSLDMATKESVDQKMEFASAGGLSMREQPASRREIQGESRWLPSLVTGGDGKAVAKIKMPETTTGWRLTARGCSVESLVGEATAATLTRKDFFVELKTPAFLREGDQIRVVARIHNLSDYSGSVPLTLRLLDAKDKTKAIASFTQSVEVAAKNGAEVTFDSFTVPSLLNLAVELSGSAGEQKDTLEQSIPVYPWGLPYVAHAGGSSATDASAVVQLPANHSYSSKWMTVCIGPDLQSGVLEMALQNGGSMRPMPISQLIPPSWGEHPANDLLAVASALAYANTGKADESYTRRLSERAWALVASLVSTQKAEGSWLGDCMGDFVSARVFWALIQARNAGVIVPKPCTEKAATYLKKELESLDANDNDGKALILHALSCDKQADFAACNRLYRDRNSLGSASLAYLACAFANLDRKEISAELAGILESRTTLSQDRSVVWESGRKITRFNDTPETTALVLLALSQSKPGSKWAESAAQSLLQMRGCFGFPTGRARGPAVAALAAWFGTAKEQTTETEITVTVNGQDVGVVKSKESHGLSYLEVPTELLKDDRNLVAFKMRGHGRYTYAATLSGFSSDTSSTGDRVHPSVDQWRYLHSRLEYRGRPIEAASSSPVKNLENGQRVSVEVQDVHGYYQGRWYVLEIPLPAGARLVADSVKVTDNAQFEVEPTLMRVYFSHCCHSVSYELTGYAPGNFRVLPPVIREVGNPEFMSVGPTSSLAVLAAGEKTPDPYEMNLNERFAFGRRYFNDGEDAKALEYLAQVFNENPKYSESELARMLLWIHTKPAFYDAHKIVEKFEILRERYPTLEIPFDKLLVVGKAYQDLGEQERAWLVYRSVISASFSNDSAISAVLEDEGRFLGSLDFQQRVWREYPDLAEVVSSYFALSQLLYQKAPKAHELPLEDHVQPQKVPMLKRASELLVSFLAMYPSDPQADDAGFSLCNALLDLKDYAQVVRLGSEFSKLYPESELAPGFQYMTALGFFWQNQYDRALHAARVVADGDSKDRDYARYILGQIYHAEGKPAEAIDWYGKVRSIYPDANEAIAYFEKKSLGMEEVTTVQPGTPVSLKLKYRNIKEAFVQVYRVDLMKLYLQQKNLSAITRVQLAGIQPESEQSVSLGTGKDYVEKEKTLPLNLKDEAAYLVICRGDDLFASAMVLITPLKIDVQEEGASGRVRVNVLDAVKGGYRPEVHVKAIGSGDSDFRSGQTDLRGLFIADNLHGKATVIAREGGSRYAFFRGEASLGATSQRGSPPLERGVLMPQSGVDYGSNISLQNSAIQTFNSKKFDDQRRQAPSKGVQVQKAY